MVEPRVQQPGWPAAAVAVAIVVLVTAISVAGIAQYEKVEDFLKIWSALAGLIGVITGAIATFFFMQKAVEDSRRDAREAQLKANHAERKRGVANDTTTRIFYSLPGDQRELLLKDPVILAWHRNKDESVLDAESAPAR